MNNIIYDDKDIANNAIRILLPYKIQRRFDPDNNRSDVLNENNVSDKMKIFLMTVCVSPCPKPKTEIYESAGLKHPTGSNIVKKCNKMKLIKVIPLSYWKGAPKEFISLTDHAYQLLNVKKREIGRRGGESEKHYLIKILTSRHFSDFYPSIELNLPNNKFVDIALEINDKLICIEIELNVTDHIKENIEKDIEAGAFKVIVCCERKILGKVREIVTEMPEHMRNNTRIYLISDMLNKEPEEIINDQF